MGVVDLRAKRIVAKVARVRERGISTFGAGSHGYQLAPPLDEAEVAALEQRLGVGLPEEFRLFLTQVARSGAGPYYGIVPPERWADALVGDEVTDWAVQPCPWTADLPRDPATWERIGEAMDEPFQGAITIADQGCANYVTLVISGAERGRVMYVSLEGGVPFFPDDRDFLSWYERWLDELLWGFDHSWFGMAMAGDEETFAATARPPSGPHRARALRAMYQLPALAEGTREVVAARIGDDDPEVRAAALVIAAKFRMGGAVEADFRRALGDPDATVRRHAVGALIASGGDWHDDVRRCLADDADEVVSTAVHELGKAGQLGDADLVPLIESPRPKVRQAALWPARTIKSQRLFDAVAAQLAAGVEDRDEMMMMVAVAQIRQGTIDASRRDAALATLLARLERATGPAAPTAALVGLVALARTHPRALDALIELTRHPQPFFRYEAARALGEVGSPAALPALRALASDTSMPTAPGRSTAWSVAENARKAIAAIEAASAARD